MKKSMRTKLAQMSERLEEINRELASQEVAKDMTRFRDLSRQHAELTQLTTHFKAFEQAERDLSAAEQMKADPDMEEFAAEEIANAQAAMKSETALLERLMLPKDPDDHKNVLLEIRAGTGGDESALFAGDLLRMYLRYCERAGWRTEILSSNESELGGYREVIVQVEGDHVFGRLKFESGGHRVQRVPATEAQGRIHTSACTVAVIAEADEVSAIKVDPQDLRIDVYRASGAGGQHVNKTESAVRVTHLPTGIVAECQDGRSQHQNKAKAMKVLLSRIEDAARRERESKEAAHRKSLVGSGDRSERIRTYNFPQGRCTDHRINLTLYKLQMMMDGDIGDMIDGLVAEEQAQRLAELGEEF
jgi:peptide chain release factor 1